jgi:hypothetical protein
VAENNHDNENVKTKLSTMLNIENELASDLGSRMRWNKVGIASMRARTSRVRWILAAYTLIRVAALPITRNA